jgi:hypothetical protein
MGSAQADNHPHGGVHHVVLTPLRGTHCGTCGTCSLTVPHNIQPGYSGYQYEHPLDSWPQRTIIAVSSLVTAAQHTMPQADAANLRVNFTTSEVINKCKEQTMCTAGQCSHAGTFLAV